MPGQSIVMRGFDPGPAPNRWSAHPVDMQQAPARYRPVWHVNHLVYEGGVPVLKRSSLTGGGFLPLKDGYAGKQNNVWLNYSTPVVPTLGSGALPKRPNFLTRLFGGAVGPSQ